MEKTEVKDEKRLYGIEGAEVMHFDPSSVVDELLDECDDDLIYPFEIEEWSVHPPSYHLPKVDRVAEWLADVATDDGDITEGGGDDWMQACRSPESIAALQAALDVIASKVTWCQAHQKLRVLTVTENPDDPRNPLIDGQPAWVKAEGAS